LKVSINFGGSCVHCRVIVSATKPNLSTLLLLLSVFRPASNKRKGVHVVRQQTMSDGESDDDDYDHGADHEVERRYPVHDCCEFDDIDALKVGL
jgi:hypothetical protein